MFGAQTGVVGEDDPGVDLESGVGQGRCGLCVGIAGAQSPAGYGRSSRPAQRSWSTS